MQFTAVGKVTKYNPRRELHGDEGVLAGDIDVTVNLPIEALDQITVDESNFKAMLYKEHGDPKQLCLKKLEFFREFADMRIELALGPEPEREKIVLNEVKIKKFVADVLPRHRVDLSFQVQLHPNERESGELHSVYVREAVGINVTPGSGQLDIENKTEEETEEVA